MPELDYRDVRVGEISVGDLLDFDKLMRGLPEQSQTIIHRKIAYEVAESEPHAALSAAQEENEDLSVRAETAEMKVENLEKESAAKSILIDELRSEVKQVERDRDGLSENVMALRHALVEAEGRHAKELQEAEARGYQTGRAEAAA